MVVFFFPKADFRLYQEAIAFSQLKADFDAAGTRVIGISKDKAAKQAKFREKHELTCALGADDDSDICEQFGVWVEKSMYGRSHMGIQRATFLIGGDGTILRSGQRSRCPAMPKKSSMRQGPVAVALQGNTLRPVLPLVAHFHGQSGFDKIIEITIQHALSVAFLDLCAQVFDHLIRMQDVRADLVTPADLSLAGC